MLTAGMAAAVLSLLFFAWMATQVMRGATASVDVGAPASGLRLAHVVLGEACGLLGEAQIAPCVDERRDRLAVTIAPVASDENRCPAAERLRAGAGGRHRQKTSRQRSDPSAHRTRSRFL